MKPIKIVLAAALMSATAAQAMAQLSSADQTFASNAAKDGLAEVALGQLAMQNAGSSAVKQFGQQMVTDHTQANQELIQIGKQKNLDLPTTPGPVNAATELRLRANKGASFDTAYMQDMIEDHQTDVNAFQQEATQGKDPALKAFAQKYLPVLQHHLQMAKGVKTTS